ncbi:MAG: Stk1 family PASTA domain-containing Ser/Thr kinase [Clostridia bacterium]|nr:Stk1 family PASTA domain-containing Ser/Thr kinase [Clostridia bacterium]
MDMVGKVLGNRYEIIEKIGSGGMATVYKAKCRVLNRNVAIKILKDEFANDAEFIKRFQVEAQSAASLSHQNIVSIFDVGKDDSMHYIVMELIEGKTLKEIIVENGKVPWKDAVKIAAQIASGLNQAHNHHIVHRDIKPHNIIITKDGVAKVTDFGIAKAVSNSTINAFGSTIGSVHYFSPEHARGGYTDEKSDIYSLGVVLYEMCTGKLPFDAETPVSVALKHLQEQPEEPKNINSEIPDALNSIILKAMQKEIANRYVSAKAFYDDLTKILKNPDDATLIKNVSFSNTEFPTQRIPVVGINTQDKNEKSDVKNTIEQDDDEMGRKKKVTKKQGIIRLIVFLLIAVVLFFSCVYLGTMISEKILGSNTTVEMIKIVGYSKEEAERMLEAIGLNMNVTGYVTDPEYPLPGYVTYQERSEGYRLKAGDTVDVRISKGGAKVIVPDVSQLSSTVAAKMQIEKNGDLVYVEAYEYHDVIVSGDIIRQDPKANDEVDVGSKITVYVSMGPASGESGLVVVPDVIGKTEAEAKGMLDASKLLARVIYANDPTKADGIVLSQSPEGNEYQTELAEIVIEVNKLSNTESGDNSGNTPTTPTTPTTPAEAKREVKIDLSTVGAIGKFNVKVVLEGNAVGKRVEYDAEHTRDDGMIVVYVTDVKNAMVKVYINDEVVSEKTL